MALFATIATGLGYTWLAYILNHFLQFLYLNLRPSSLPRYGKKHRLYTTDAPTWALVTGASDGLGVAFAHELAASRFNVIIHGRNQAKLDGIKADIEAKHKVQVRTLVIDAERQPTALDEASYGAFDNTVRDAIRDIDLTLLVNNIGVLGTWEPVAERTAVNIDSQINMNVRFATQLTRVLLPTLAKNKPATILNVSSEADASPVAYAVMYSAAKAWGQAFHRSLKYEVRYEGHDVEIMSVIFGLVATASTGRTDEDVGFAVPTAQQAARAALNKIGCGHSVVTPVLGHQIQGAVARMLPDSVRERLVATVMREQKSKMEALGKKA